VDRSSAEGASSARQSRHPRCREVWDAGRGCPPPRRRKGLGRGLNPSLENFLLFELKMEHFGAVFNTDLAEETRMQ